MDFPWYIYKGGQGGIPGGGGATWFWTEESPVTPEEYYYDCGNDSPRPFLGYCYGVSLDPLAIKILTEQRLSGDNMLFYVYEHPHKILDDIRVSGREYEYEYLQDYPCLVQPEGAFNRGSVTALSEKFSATEFQVFVISFLDGIYFSPVGCFPGLDALVRLLRGTAYIDSLEIGEYYPGISGTYSYKYQTMSISPFLLPGRVRSSLVGGGGRSGGGGASGSWGDLESLGVKLRRKGL